MRFSPFVERIAGEGASAWDLHIQALKDRRAGRNVIVLSIGDPDFDTPPAISEATIAALRDGDTHYSDILGLIDLRQAIGEWHRARSGQEVGAENVAVVAGAQCGLFVAAQCLIGPGDGVAVLEPMYVTYEATVQSTGAHLIRVAQRPENGFHLNSLDLEAAITPATRAILFATPSNPTGAMMARRTLEQVAEIAIRHDLWVVADEVYAMLTFEGEHVSIAGVPGMAERTVTINSLSKSHAMTGWRMGWMVAPPELIRHAFNLGLAMLYGLPGFMQRGALAAFRLEIPEVAEMREAYRRRRDRVSLLLTQAPLIKVLTPEAGMFMMLDVRPTGMSARDFAWRLYRETGVALLDATHFGVSAEGHVRLSFATDDASLEEACRRIVAFANGLAARADVA